MKTHFLFPNQYKKIGWILFIPAFIASLIISILDANIDDYWHVRVFAILNDSLNGNISYFTTAKNGIIDEVLTLCLILGGILIGFSKLKIEDEFTTKIRYESLVWAIYLNYGLILFFTVFIYGLWYLNVLFYNTFTLLLFFIVRFHYMIYKLNKSTNDDE